MKYQHLVRRMLSSMLGKTSVIFALKGDEPKGILESMEI